MGVSVLPVQPWGDDGSVQLAGSVVKGAHESVWSHGFTPCNGLLAP